MNKIINDNCLSVLKTMNSGVVDLVITSPPYDNLRNYNDSLEWNFSIFRGIADELIRVLCVGGVIVWVVSDATLNGSETGSSFKQALYFMEKGLNLHDTMIWIKDGGGAVGSNNCYTQNFEYMFVLSKGTPKTINLIKDKVNKSYGVDKSGVGRRNADGEHKIEQRKEANPYSKRNNWWYIPPQRSDFHPAVFPDKLAHDHIITWSNKGDLVLDCFSGSGTVPLMCEKLGRNYIGIEKDKEYYEKSMERLKAEKVKKKLI